MDESPETNTATNDDASVRTDHTSYHSLRSDHICPSSS